jgi:methylthioribose-1-phosphate isomerase
MLPTFEWRGDHLLLLDQRFLPDKEDYLELRDYTEIADAIRNMAVRGAPAIGIVAGYGVVLGVKAIKRKDNLEEKFREICEKIEGTRPTARNLFFAIERMKRVFEKVKDKELDEIKIELEKTAVEMEREDYDANMRLSRFGAELIKNNSSVLTHCNAGGLATSGWGTALGIIKMAHRMGKNIHVYVDETRPLLQGARLTTFELSKEGIPFTLITDNMAGWIMKKGKISAVIVGADRITTNGDTANKIGTYSLSVLARENSVPFYVAAPVSTIDFNLKSGDEIPIEERDENEVKSIIKGIDKLKNLKVENPAFDVTPNELITAIITEFGVLRPPYKESLAKIKEIVSKKE